MDPAAPASDFRVWKDHELARTYLDGVRAAIPLAGEQLDIMRRVVLAACPDAMSVLDLGCGDGVLGRCLLDALPRASGYFVDFSEPMLERARIHPGMPAGRCAFLSADYSEPGWEHALPAAEFDVVVSGYSIHHQPDDKKRAVYQSVFRLLRPGGVFLNLEHVASASAWGESVADDMFVDSLWALHRRLGTASSRAEVAGEFVNREDKTANILSPVWEQCGWLRKIGFEKVDCFFKVFELALFGGIKPVRA